jgi:hypothetical protein
MNRNRRTAAAVAGYLLAAVASAFAAVWLLDLRRADLRVPFDYRGDALLYALTAKGVVDHGWYLRNPLLGAPFALELHDYPFADQLHHLAIKGMALVSSDWALIFNVYFLLGFPLITLSALAVFRHFRVAWGPAIVGSVLYAYLPSRLLMGEQHVFMGMFFEVPLALLVVLWVCGERPPFWRQDGPGIEVRSARTVAAIGICVLTAFTGLYYAFFTGCLLLLGGVWGSVVRRSWGNALAGLALAGIIVTAVGAGGLPTLEYRTKHGPNDLVAVRDPSEAEMYGLKMVQLVLPVDGHRLPTWRALKDRYNKTAPLVGENSFTSLGVMGTIGFVTLLLLLFLGPRRERVRDDLWRTLAVLNLAALLLGTIGGLGSLFALLVTPQIRTYARLNVVIGFLALFALVLLLERLYRRRRWLGIAALPVVLVLGLLDQATPLAARPYAEVRAEYASDAALVRTIEAAVPRGGQIFQLPHVSFPEGAMPFQVLDYDPLRPYFHSSTLRWSYPTMRGRPPDTWVDEVSRFVPADLVKVLSDAGFDGILVDRFGYGDQGREMEAALGKALDATAVVSRDRRQAFFSLTSYNQRAHAGESPEVRAAKREHAMHPLVFTWGKGFFDEERDPFNIFRWCSGTCDLEVRNDAATDRQASLQMTLMAAQPPANLFIEGDIMAGSLELKVEGTKLTHVITVPPGRHVLRLRSDGKRADAPGDPRVLVWRAVDYFVGEKL